MAQIKILLNQYYEELYICYKKQISNFSENDIKENSFKLFLIGEQNHNKDLKLAYNLNNTTEDNPKSI